jgi:hypothetical protein
MKNSFYNFVSTWLNLIGILEMFAATIWALICITSPEYGPTWIYALALGTTGLLVTSVGQIMNALSRIVDGVIIL